MVIGNSKRSCVSNFKILFTLKKTDAAKYTCFAVVKVYICMLLLYRLPVITFSFYQFFHVTTFSSYYRVSHLAQGFVCMFLTYLVLIKASL